MTSLESSGLNAGYVGQLLEQYLENPEARRSGMARRLRGGRRRTPRRASGPRASCRRSRRARRQRRDQSCRRRARAPCLLRRAPAPPAPAPAPPPTPELAADGELVGGVAAAMSLVKAYRTHGHLNARLDPLGSEPMGDPALDETRLVPPLTPELQARIPAKLLRLSVPGEHAPGRAPAVARGLHGDDRVRDRAHLGPRRARLASPGDRVRPLSPSLARRRAALAPRATGSGRGVRDVPAARIHRSEAVLDRGARRARADARRSGRARAAERRARGAASASRTAVASTS